MDPNDPRLDELARRMSRIRMVSSPEKQKELLRSLATPQMRALARGAGVDIDSVLKLTADAQRSSVATLQAAIYFGPLGWMVLGHQISSAHMIEAVDIWEATHDEAAIDQHLVDAWANYNLKRSFGPMTTLGGDHGPTLDLLLERDTLLRKALEHHERGEFVASTLIVLTQIDGLTFDFTEPSHGFFYDAKDDFFEDDTTLAGMPDFLRVVRHAVHARDAKTSMSTSFHRHPIVHGRYPAFGTVVNSTKAFALLSGVIEWLAPKAKVLTEKWQAASPGSEASLLSKTIEHISREMQQARQARR
jgi:hypothetical protein